MAETYTIEQIGQRVRQRKPEAFGGFSDTQIGERMIQRSPELKSLVAQPKPVETPEKQGLLSRAGSFIAKDVFGGVKEDTNLLGDIFRGTVGSRGLSGVAQLPGKVIGQSGLSKDQVALSQSLGGLSEQTTKLIKSLRTITDPQRKQQLQNLVQSNLQTLKQGGQDVSALEKEVLTPRETIATTLGAGLTALTGSGSTLTGAARSALGKTSVGTLSKFPKLVPGVEKALTVGKGVVPRAVEQAGIGAGFTASENIRAGRDIGENVGTGALVGAALPFGGLGASKIGSKVAPARNKLAQRYIDSLIKPLLRDFSYGKNPGKRIATEGITFNSLEDGVIKVAQRKSEVGSEIDQAVNNFIYKNKPTDISHVIKPIEEEIVKLSKSPRTNQNAIKRLVDVRDDLLGVSDGVITKDLSNMTLPEIVQFKKDVGALTKFTGNASDDAVYNKALKRVYGMTKEEANKINPRLKELNERYADLLTAENAIKYRDKIASRQNIISYPSKTVTGLLAGGGVVTLNPALIVAAVLNVGVEKALSSSAFKTRLAKWLATSTAKERNTIIRDVPVMKNIFDRIFGEEKSALNFKNTIQKTDNKPSYVQIRGLLDSFDQSEGRLLLPEGKPPVNSIVLPAQLRDFGRSSVKGVDAPKTFGKDVSTGRFKRVFTGEKPFNKK
jgi:uncharacterized lipoprotein YehR (DUF1307 family)